MPIGDIYRMTLEEAACVAERALEEEFESSSDN
jgi:hypothetical protein